jgi:molybdenum cofactor cytidylyltransferase
MKFGPVGLEDALGAVLAHSVAVAEGRRLRKGRVLSAEDVATLAEAGLAEVTVARLDPGDVAEDAAAEALARAFVPDPASQRLRLTSPFTGRVNLIAQGPGVAVIDEEAVEAVNRIDPMITIATVPAYQQMAEGGMVATIKIISYAVPRAALDAACAAARAGMRLAPPQRSAARLIVSDIPGGVGDKGWPAIADRVAAFGLDLPPPLIVQHRVDALAQAVRDSDGDLIMILTGSATSDIMDVAPQAVVAAGGRVDRFGMPVDPGNLLFVGERAGVPVIGLPGCARAPALNGADWVLSRVICGVQVTGADIAGMGVGGLLKEIPSRPQPRRGRDRT